MEQDTLLSQWEEGFKKAQSDDVCTCFDDDSGVIVEKTYKNIYDESCIIKETILKAKCEKEVIGLIVSDGGNVVAGIIGILSAGAAFHCIPTDIPCGWLEYLITALRIRVIVGRNEDIKILLSKLSGFSGTVEEIEANNHACVMLSNVSCQKLTHDIVYVITTSGTTGTPKIVWVPNRCITPNITCFRKVFNITSRDTVFQASPLTFDPSVVEIFMALSVGAKLVMIPESLKRQPSRLGRILSTMKVTVIQSTPTLVASMGREYIRGELLCKNSYLRVLALGGEKFPEMQVIQSWKDKKNQTEIFNLYGITEVSSWATWCHITKEMLEEDLEVPLGLAIPDTLLKIVDSSGNLSDMGLLHIGGRDRVCLIDAESDLVPGTFRNTGDIVRRDLAGNIWYEGRSDDQVKRLGKRLNLMQIEQVLQKVHPDITAAALNNEDRKALYVFVCVDYKIEESLITALVQSVKDTLKENLPAQYQPDHVQIVDAMPVTHHGKVDKARLIEMLSEEKGTNQNFPEQMTEYILEKLDIQGSEEDVALNKSFFDLGGTSFQAVNFIQYIEDVTKVTLSNDIWEKLTQLPLKTVLQEIFKFIKSENCVTDHKLLPKGVSNPHEDNKRVMSPLPDKSIGHLFANKRKKQELCSCVHFQNHLEKTGYKWYSVQRSNRVHVSCNKLSTAQDVIGCSKEIRLDKCSDYTGNSLGTSTDLSLAIKWKYNLGKCNDASPFLWINNSGTKEVYIGSHSHRMACIDLLTGLCKWDITLPDRIESSACVTTCGHYVVVGCYDGNVYSIERISGSIYWTYPTGGEVKSSPCIHPLTGMTYVGSHDQHLHCINVQEKKCIWKQYVDGGSVFSSPVVSLKPHLVIAATLAGTLVALEPISGNTVWKAMLGKPIFSSPAISCNNVYVGCVDRSMHCFSLSGQQVWTYKTEGPVFSSPCVYPNMITRVSTETEKSSSSATKSQQNIPEPSGTCTASHVQNIICFGCHDSYVYCLCDDRKLLWKFKTDSPVYATPFVTSYCGFRDRMDEQNWNIHDKASTTLDKTINKKNCRLSNARDSLRDNRVVVVASTRGIIYILSLDTGRSVANLELPEEVFSSAVVTDENVVVGCRDDNIYCLNIKQ